MELWQLFMKFKAVMKVIGISFEIKITIILTHNLAIIQPSDTDKLWLNNFYVYCVLSGEISLGC